MRVMLSHVRMKFDSWETLKAQCKHMSPGTEKHHPDKLRAVYDSMTRVFSPTPPATGPNRSGDKSQSHPFVFFRSSSSIDEFDEGRGEERHEVCRHFCVGELTAQIVFADGTKSLADKYEPGVDGFVLALWENGTDLKLEVCKVPQVFRWRFGCIR